jgi:hypothetical protein
LKIRTAVAIYDLHYPQYHAPTWEAILDFISQNKVDVFIFGGDQLHLDCISHHTKAQPLYRVRRGYRNDIEGFDRDILSTLQRVLPKTCEKVWHIGNHERFEHDLIEEHPELEDAINHVKLLCLNERGWKVIELGHAYRLGKLITIHGEVLSGIGNQAGMYPSKKAVELYAGNVLAGHTHAAQSFTRVSPVEHSDKWQGWISPIAGAVNPSYLRNRPTAWINGFNIIEVFPDGQFNLYPVNVVKGRFSYGGKVYGKKV